MPSSSSWCRKNIVRHLVATVDNLPRRKVAVSCGRETCAGQERHPPRRVRSRLSDGNFERYAPLVRVVQATDVKALVLVYERLYPLYQQAYEDLGYPGKYFNDRLVEVIDHLLQRRKCQRRSGWCSPRCSTNTRHRSREPFGRTEAADPHGSGKLAPIKAKLRGISRRDRKKK